MNLVGGVALLLGTVLFQVNPGEKTRIPAPEVSRQREAHRSLKKLYRKEYSDRSPQARGTFARTLLDQAETLAGDDALRFMLYWEGCHLAAEAFDFDTSFGAADRAAEIFEIEAVRFKESALKTASRAKFTREEGASVAAAYLRVAEEAGRADDYDAAEDACSNSETLAKKCKDLGVVMRARKMKKEMGALKKEYLKVRLARQKIQSGAGDPGRRLLWGGFLCFVKGDWERGLPLLAACSDSELAGAAEKDLAGPDTPDAQRAVGDAWWALAEKEKVASRRLNGRMRAAHWYEKVEDLLDERGRSIVGARIDWVRERTEPTELTAMLGSGEAGDGLSLREAGDGKFKATRVGGKACVGLVPAGAKDGARYLYFDVRDGWIRESRDVEVEVEAYEASGGSFGLQYDAEGAENSAKFRGAGKVNLSGKPGWKTFTFQLPGAWFRGRQNFKSDFRLNRTPGADLFVRRVIVRKKK